MKANLGDFKLQVIPRLPQRPMELRSCQPHLMLRSFCFLFLWGILTWEIDINDMQLTLLRPYQGINPLKRLIRPYSLGAWHWGAGPLDSHDSWQES